MIQKIYNFLEIYNKAFSQEEQLWTINLVCVQFRKLDKILWSLKYTRIREKSHFEEIQNQLEKNRQKEDETKLKHYRRQAISGMSAGKGELSCKQQEDTKMERIVSLGWESNTTSTPNCSIVLMVFVSLQITIKEAHKLYIINRKPCWVSKKL